MSTVALKYQIYNSLFLNLPYRDIESTGTHLALFAQECRRGFAEGKSPADIIETFLGEYFEQAAPDERLNLLFQFIQYAERQVVLFDSIEDATFRETHDLEGKGSVKHLLARLDSDERRAKLVAKLGQFCVRIVLTAHPTQFYPGKVLGIINDLGQAIRESDLEQIELLLRQLGRTAFVNRTRPTPLDEAISLGWYLENVFYNALPDSVFRLFSGLGLSASDFPNARLLALGFWPGGDRDGNPFVTADTTVQVAKRLREGILRCYYRDIRALKRRLTFRGVEECIGAIENKIYATLYEPDGREKTYANCTELLTDLAEARQILATEYEGLFMDLLERFILKVRMFGFFFASLDIRQDSRKHGEVWQHILKNLESRLPIFSLEKFNQWDEDQRINFLLTNRVPVDEADFDDPFVKETIRSFRAVAQIQRENGAAGCHRYIISNCQSALNVVEVLALARLTGDGGRQTMDGKNDDRPSAVHRPPSTDLDIVPLFETVEDLAAAGPIMEKLYTNPHYAAHLDSRDRVQHIMLGFSDGTKDGGYLRANWSIFRAKEALTRISRAHGVSVIFFDGRGGPPGRGGGNNANYYAAHGPEIENREIHVTIQGQTISSTYGTETAARFNIERLFTAGLERHIFGGGEFSEAGKKLLDELAEAAYRAYLQLKNSPDFVPYLEKMTPLKWYGDTNIASRPTKRGNDAGLKFEDLRAIPFVGAWAQMKQNVPGFYGFGSAVEALESAGKAEAVRQLYHESLFFRTLVENSMQSLSKSNYDVTRWISGHEQFGSFWQMLHDEFRRTDRCLLEISGQAEKLGENPISRESIQLREAIVLPLIAIQQFALQKLQAEKVLPAEAEVLRRLVLRAMFGIINAARNSA
ncbi:MAG: phosphoenolpyruvate carboxylase [Saprospiraceae bacterium]